MKRFPRLPSPAMVIACIALLVALGGTSYAAITLPKNSVGTKQLRNNAVTTPKVKNNAITGAKVKNNAIAGADVLESSLAKVPAAAAADTATTAVNATNATNATNAVNATNAGNANSVGGATVRKFVVAVVNGGAQQTVLDLNGLLITLTCPGGAPALRANNNSGGAAQFRWDGHSGGAAFDNGYQNFGAGSNAVLDNGGNFGSGSSHYIRLNGTAVTAHYGWRSDDLGGAGVACRVFGYAIGG